MPWTFDIHTNTWTASEFSDLNMTTANNLIVHGQPYQPSDGGLFDASLSSNFQSSPNPNVTVQMPQSQIMNFGYGAGVQVSDFGVNSLLGENLGLEDRTYTRAELIDAGVASMSDFQVFSTLYTPGANVADGGAIAAYVHGSVGFAIGTESTFVVENGVLIEISGDLRAFDDNFNFESDSVPDLVNTIIQYTLGPGSDVPEGAIVFLEYRGDGRLDIATDASWIEVLNGLKALVNENLVQPLFESMTGQAYCFGLQTPVAMWPTDTPLKPNSNGLYNQSDVRAKIWHKPIEQIEPGDLVVSFDAEGNLVPGPVTRIFENDAKILLDFHGTKVTPGHVYLRPDSSRAHKFETLIDVLRDDGVIQHQDGTLIRAATNVPVGDARDGFVKAVTGTRNTDGQVIPLQEGRIRLGTRFIVGEGEQRKSYAVADLIEAGGGVVGEDELIRVGDDEGVPFHWEFSDTLPNPEDFVLACSGTTLEDIYKAAEWESQGPRLPAPMVLDGGQVKPLTGAALTAMPRNEPLGVEHGIDGESEGQKA